MQNLRLAPEEEGDDLYAGFELNEGLWNVRCAQLVLLGGEHSTAPQHTSPTTAIIDHLALSLFLWRRFLLLQELDDDAGLQKAIQTSYGQRPPVAVSEPVRTTAHTRQSTVPAAPHM